MVKYSILLLICYFIFMSITKFLLYIGYFSSIPEYIIQAFRKGIENKESRIMVTAVQFTKGSAIDLLQIKFSWWMELLFQESPYMPVISFLIVPPCSASVCTMST